MKSLAFFVLCATFLSTSALAQPLACSAPGDAPRTVRRELVELVAAGNRAFRDGKFLDAASLADSAAPHAKDAGQLQWVLSLRSAALAAAHDDAQLVGTLERRLKVGCHQHSGEAEELAGQLDAARSRLGLQRQ